LSRKRDASSHEPLLSLGGGMNENQRGSRWLIPAVATLMTAASAVLLQALTSPEFSWDEADLLGSTSRSWWALWSSADYRRHFHGPMGIYLAKLGHEALPAALGSVEARTRFPTLLVASSAVGLLYWILIDVFETSRAAALVGSSLLLLSFIRLEETNVIGPHHLMLVCVLALLALAYRWRNEPTKRTALWLGAVLGLSALTMTYVIPTALCAAAALTLTGSQWIVWEEPRLAWAWPKLRISKWLLAALGTGAVVLVILWPPGVFKLRLVKDFGAFVLMGHHPTLVADHVFEITPRWAALYWFIHLDAPLLFVSAAVISTAFWRAFRTRSFSSRHVYLGFCLAFFVGTALTAHLAGARNLLQVVGVLCLATGALFDEAVGRRPRALWLGAAAIVLLALTNLVWLSRSSSYTPFLATGGYRAFVTQGASRLREKAKAVVYGLPVLSVYAREAGLAPAWDVSEMPWTSLRDGVHIPDDVKYVLIPAFIYEDMPADHAMRRIIAEHWKVVWSFRGPGVWELRLFERPAGGA
jgi:hypothetical protein